MTHFLIRILMLLVGATIAALSAETVRVEFATQAGASLKDRYGDYCPMKVLWADRVYDPVKVLEPTRMPFTRLEWPEDIKDPDQIDPKMFDGRHSQEVIIKQLRSRGIRPLVCIRVPKAFKHDMKKIERFYHNVTKKVASLTESTGADIELFNEPDLLTLDLSGSHSPGSKNDLFNQDRFIERYKAAYTGAMKGLKKKHVHRWCGFRALRYC